MGSWLISCYYPLLHKKINITPISEMKEIYFDKDSNLRQINNKPLDGTIQVKKCNLKDYDK